MAVRQGAVSVLSGWASGNAKVRDSGTWCHSFNSDANKRVILSTCLLKAGSYF